MIVVFCCISTVTKDLSQRQPSDTASFGSNMKLMANDTISGRAPQDRFTLRIAACAPLHRVLVAGGAEGDLDNYANTLSSAEMYVPITIPKIVGASVAGKRLFGFGEGFDLGATILINGEEQRTIGDAANPETTLIAKRLVRKSNRVTTCRFGTLTARHLKGSSSPGSRL